MGNRPRPELKIPVLMYHEIERDIHGSSNQKQMHPSYYVDAHVFEKQLDIIRESGRVPIDLDQLTDSFDGGLNGSGDTPLVITFDDGLAGNYRYAYPLLKSKQMTAVFFCATSLVGKRNMMQWEQLREMADSGMSIQSHTVSHLPLASLNRKEISYELEYSKSLLEDKIQKQVSFLSLPHGSYNRYIIQAAGKAGYKKVCTSVIGYNTGGEYCLNRILLGAGYSTENFRAIIQTSYNFASLRRKQQLKYAAKTLIGHGNYLRLYHLFHHLEK